MQNDFTFRGPSAEVRWGYHQAAALGAWEFKPVPGGGTVTAQVVSADTFRLSQPALTFVLPRSSGPWTWPVKSLQHVGPTLVMSVGLQEG